MDETAENRTPGTVSVQARIRSTLSIFWCARNIPCFPVLSFSFFTMSWVTHGGVGPEWRNVLDTEQKPSWQKQVSRLHTMGTFSLLQYILEQKALASVRWLKAYPDSTYMSFPTRISNEKAEARCLNHRALSLATQQSTFKFFTGWQA